jgi:hypothetical protein
MVSRSPVAADAAQRGLQVAHAGGGRVVRVVGEDVEEEAAEHLLAGAAGHAQELLVGVRVHQVGVSRATMPGRPLEHRRVVDLRITPGHVPTVEALGERSSADQ